MNNKVKKLHWNASINCNMNCKFCYLWKNVKENPLRTDEAMGLINQAARYGMEWFVFGGGDPLLRKDLPNLVAYAKTVGLKTDIQTNAILLNKYFLEAVNGSIDRIGLSIDGHDENTHDSIRNYKGNFNIVNNALRLCDNFNIPVVVRSTVMRPNVGRLYRIGDILSNYNNILKWSIREYIALGRGITNRGLFFIPKHIFNDEYLNILNYNKRLINRIKIISVSSYEMNNCYCLVSPGGNFYNHPTDGIYKSVGKFPDKYLDELAKNISYDIGLRSKRDNKALIPI